MGPAATEQHVHNSTQRIHTSRDGLSGAKCCHRAACCRWFIRQETLHTFGSWPPAIVQRQMASTPGCSSLTMFTGALHFPFSRFKHCYLSLQSPVSSFPHGTCLLLGSNMYSAFDEVYHPLHAPVPRSMTLGMCTVHLELQMSHRILTFINALFQGHVAASQLVEHLNPTIQVGTTRLSKLSPP